MGRPPGSSNTLQAEAKRAAMAILEEITTGDNTGTLKEAAVRMVSDMTEEQKVKFVVALLPRVSENKNENTNKDQSRIDSILENMTEEELKQCLKIKTEVKDPSQ